MTRYTRNEAQPESEPAERDLQDLAQRVISPAEPVDESGAALETVSLGHAGPRNECWSGASVMGLGGGRGESAAVRLAAQRLRRPPRRRTPLHRLRPSPPAEARFAPDDRELLTC